MEINYVEHKDGTKLFSWNRHDFKTYGKGDDYIMIDGGFDYTRYSGKLKTAEISDIIKDIRNDFTWGQNYDKDMNRLPETIRQKLKDLETGHIFNILKNFTERLSTDDSAESCMTVSWKAIHLIFLEELYYREENNLL